MRGAPLKPAKMFYKFYGDPDGDELAGNWNELQKEPDLLQFHFFYHTPGIVKGISAFHGLMPAFLNVPYKPICHPIVTTIKIIQPFYIVIILLAKLMIAYHICFTADTIVLPVMLFN